MKNRCQNRQASCAVDVVGRSCELLDDLLLALWHSLHRSRPAVLDSVVRLFVEIEKREVSTGNARATHQRNLTKKDNVDILLTFSVLL